MHTSVQHARKQARATTTTYPARFAVAIAFRRTLTHFSKLGYEVSCHGRLLLTMSFGFSIGDLATLIAVTKKTYDSWSQAPKEYADVVRTLSESKTLLCHVQNRFDALTGIGRDDAAKQEEIESLLRGCQSAISELRAVVKRRRKLGHWDRIKLGSSSHVHECRARLARHINILTPFLFSLELESIGKDVGCLPAILDRLPQAVTNALPAALGRMIDERIEDSRTARGSIMTTYGDDDDKQAYKELRRNLRFFGIKDAVVRQQRAKLVEFIKTLTQEDQSTIFHEADGGQQLLEEQVVSVPSPVLVPLVVDSAKDVEIALKPWVGTRARCQYQAYVETEDEDEDDLMESTIAGPSNDITARRPENAEGFAVHSDEAHIVEEAEDRAKDTPDTTQGTSGAHDFRGRAVASKGRRKYQAYVETEDEEEIPQDPVKFLLDSSGPAVSDVWPQKSQTDPATGAKEHHLSSTELDDDPQPPTSDEDANLKPDTRRYTLPHRTLEATDRLKSQFKHEPGWRRKGSPAPAVCGDWGYQKCLDSSSSDSENSNSMVARASRRNSYCSSCDQQLTSGDEAAWEQLSNDGSNWSDSEQQHSEIYDDASKIAHSGDTDGEEVSPTKAYDARRPKQSQERARPKPKPNTFPFPPSPDVESPAPRPLVPQRMIEYKPLQVSEEGLLTIQLHMPAGYSIHVEGGRIAQFHNPCVLNTWRQFFPTLPPNKEYYHPNCLHGFPGAPLPDWIDMCGCQVFYWTPALQYWNPTFVDGLREWVKG
jgi:hypothetical protein